jgi:two-component system cell cycle sensor histidine kinase PleC
MSHELRTPLNAIMDFSEVIGRAQDAPDLRQRHAEYAGFIHESGEHLLSLINDVLDLAKIEAGQVTLEYAPFDLADLVTECVTLMRPVAARGDLDLAMELPAATGLYDGDRRALKQILLNLLSNAIKFTPPRGSVTVALTDADGAPAVRVVDTGIGITAEALAGIFEPFNRGDAMTAREHEGTGLGLAISRRLARRHGGDILIASVMGEGTTVTLLLPAAPASDPPNEAIVTFSQPG